MNALLPSHHRPVSPGAAPAVEPAHAPAPPCDALAAALDSLSLRLDAIYLNSPLGSWRERYPGTTTCIHLVLAGQCQLQLDDQGEIVTLSRGEAAVVRAGHAHTLRHTAGPVPPAATRVLSGELAQALPPALPRLGTLPACLRLQSTATPGGAGLWQAVRGLTEEMQTDRPGALAILGPMLHLLFTHAVRDWMTRSTVVPGGWSQALHDPGIGPVLAAMHERLGQPWTVQSLARVARLSRSVFAQRFHALVGQPPLQYLTDCRMRHACRLLREERLILKEVAAAVGYATEPAFANAFKRWAGVAPGAYRKGHDPVRLTARQSLL